MASAASLPSQEGNYIILTIVFFKLSKYFYGQPNQRYFCANIMSDNALVDICEHLCIGTAMSPYLILCNKCELYNNFACFGYEWVCECGRQREDWVAEWSVQV